MSATNTSIDLAAGGIAGLVADAVTHPIDTVRTRLWSQDHPSTQGYKYRGLWHGLVDMMKKEGTASLFKGLGSVLLLTPVGHGLYFASYEWSKERLRDIKNPAWRPSEPVNHLCAGFFANGVGGLIWTPMDVVKQRQQAVVKDLYGPIEGLVSIWKSHGFFNGLQRGYWSGMATYGPFSAIYFMIYENFKSFCVKREIKVGSAPLAGSSSISSAEARLHTGHFVVGGFLAGTVAAIATAPIDLVKTRMQVFDGCGYDGMLSTTLKILREEGKGVFMRGLLARVIWIAPGCSLTIAVYEDVRKSLRSLVWDHDLEHGADEVSHGPPVLIRHRVSGALHP
eukprot:CAMPEP_0177689344 /NCGR_PEP_ID=MMETSP0484_2-20121128/137_1 /TAXON_ID=354590 /ORGANISM="Rhodomonas lens, Strain RHODO" /LENGTH=337 /DNA_ID=CAMNT_0019199723 /DNA_START=164 /DNA_END=1174 /DNA_ORIENTATION=-